MGTANPTGYSADVRLWLERQDVRVPLSHTADTFVIARQAVELPPGDATVVFVVDGVRHQRGVRLPVGMRPAVRETPVDGVGEAAIRPRPVRDR